MTFFRTKSLIGGAGALLTLLAMPNLSAQGRVVLPEGSVIIVKTTTSLESSTARVGQTFETEVADTVRIENYIVIPECSRIRGVVTYAQPATRQRSGVIEVTFDRLTLPDGKVYALNGKLTSTDASERRRIDADPNARVVLVGGRGGVGAAIAAASSESAPASNILSALGGLLSEGRDVRVPVSTALAVQLEQGLVLNRRGAIARAPDAFTIYTSTERVRTAQQALAQQNYYRGAINGSLDDATQRALFEYQVDHGIIATGNLDGRTAQALGLGTVVAAGTPILSAEEATVVRRGAQALVGRDRMELGIASSGRLDPRRAYTEGDLDLWFSLSAFADNASLYEQMLRVSGNSEGLALAGKALVSAARRVDTAIQQGSARPSTQLRSAWSSLRAQLTEIDANYR